MSSAEVDPGTLAVAAVQSEENCSQFSSYFMILGFLLFQRGFKQLRVKSKFVGYGCSCMR